MKAMGLFTATASEGYAHPRMAQPKMGDGPWGIAIRYWLNERKMRQADLLRAVHDAHPNKRITANTISNATRGLHCSTRTLSQIATALKVRVDEVLVSPDRQLANEDRRRLAREISEEVLRTVDARQGITERVIRQIDQPVRQIDQPPDARRALDESFRAAEMAAQQLEQRQATKKTHAKARTRKGKP
jgi:hypothetical protein